MRGANGSPILSASQEYEYLRFPYKNFPIGV